MRDSEHQHDNNFLAAHVLSSSCANSGVVVRSVPNNAVAQVPDARFRQILRLRFGVPCVMPLAQSWQCNCTDQRRAEAQRVGGEDSPG